jgi:hypothetical protein
MNGVSAAWVSKTPAIRHLARHGSVQARALRVGRRDYRIVVLVTVGDGTLTSAPVPIRITVPDKVDVSHNGHGINVSKYAARAHLRHGDCLGTSGIR